MPTVRGRRRSVRLDDGERRPGRASERWRSRPERVGGRAGPRGDAARGAPGSGDHRCRRRGPAGAQQLGRDRLPGGHRGDHRLELGPHRVPRSARARWRSREHRAASRSRRRARSTCGRPRARSPSGVCEGLRRVTTRSGGIRIRSAAAIDVTLSSGRLEAEAIGDAQVRSGSGRVSLGLERPGSGKVSSLSRPGHRDVGRRGATRVHLVSRSGRVRSEVDAGTDGNLSIESLSGAIKVTRA